MSRHAVHAEWTKLRTTRGVAWLLLAAAVLTVATAAVLPCPRAGCDTVGIALSGVYLGQLPVAVLGVLTVSGEHSTGLIRTTLTAAPHRPAVLAAKALVLAAVVTA